jgi:hypothetical protein
MSAASPAPSVIRQAKDQQGVPLKNRVLIAVAVLAMAASAPPTVLDLLGKNGSSPLVEAMTYIQHINLLTS